MIQHYTNLGHLGMMPSYYELGDARYPSISDQTESDIITQFKAGQDTIDDLASIFQVTREAVRYFIEDKAGLKIGRDGKIEAESGFNWGGLFSNAGNIIKDVAPIGVPIATNLILRPKPGSPAATIIQQLPPQFGRQPTPPPAPATPPWVLPVVIGVGVFGLVGMTIALSRK